MQKALALQEECNAYFAGEGATDRQHLSIRWRLLLAGEAGAGALDTPGYDKAFSCSACHGAAGNSRTDAMPILAGMSPAYFKKAIEDYATGKRVSPEMEPFAKQV